MNNIDFQKYMVYSSAIIVFNYESLIALTHVIRNSFDTFEVLNLNLKD